MQSCFFTYKNTTKIHYQVGGSGPALLLIHGFGEDGNVWNGMAKALEKTSRLIIPDLPGSGKSGLPEEDANQVTINDYAAVIVSLLNKEGIDTCTAIGHSMGGYITLSLAAGLCDRLNGFGLLNSTAFADSDDKKSARLKSVRYLENNDAASYLNTSVPGLFAEKFKSEHSEKVQELIDSLSYFNKYALIQYQKAMIARPDRVDVLKNTPLPVLFIISEKDPAIPLQKSLEQCHLPPVSFVHILKQAGHMSLLEETATCVAIVSEFMKYV